MLTSQEYADLIEIYNTLEEGYFYFKNHEPDDEIFSRLQIERRRDAIDKILNELQFTAPSI